MTFDLPLPRPTGSGFVSHISADLALVGAAEKEMKSDGGSVATGFANGGALAAALKPPVTPVAATGAVNGAGVGPLG